MNKDVFDLVSLVDNCIKRVKHLAEQNEIKISLECPEALKTCADKERIEEILNNLLSNAIKYNFQGGTIKIKLAKDKNNRNILIKDSGVGLTEYELSHLFEKFSLFERKDPNLVIKEKGTGLGLFIAKRIVEKHRGEIWANSEGRNKGSQFHVRIPSKL